MGDIERTGLTGDVRAELLRAGVGDVRSDELTRGIYSTDASLYRVVPQTVAFPREAAEMEAILDVARRTGVPITARGAGTSCAGNAVGPGIVVDTSRYLHKVLGVDPESRTARVQPGTVHATLQRAAQAVGLRFGPDPSSHTRCTVGGMIGNNACGNRALGYGRTSDNVVAVTGLTGTGERFTARTGLAGETPTVAGVDALVGELTGLTAAHLGVIRTEFARFGRQVSGYACEHLLPENGLDLGRLMVGSEGTLALVTEAEVRLVTDPPHTLLVLLAFPNIGAAGDVAHLLRGLGAVAGEGIDRRIVDVVRVRIGPHAVPDLPAGGAWLMVEVTGDTAEEAMEKARRVQKEVPADSARIVVDPGEAQALWRIRENGAGLSGRTPAGRPGHAGWEDCAVPPERFGDYLRDFDALLEQHGLTCIPYGHFGDGCLHARIDFPLDRPGGTARYRAFVEEAADLVATHSGTISGEHGDGRARSEMLPRMYSPEAMALFAGIKHAFDPENLLNPGVLVDPEPFDADLRVPAARRDPGRLAFTYPADSGDFTQAVHRCTGQGRCRATPPEGTATAGVMCPSYQATREEKDSTRGRARALQEILNGPPGPANWRSPALLEALDLCLACKGCANDCPTGIDMATYKAEALHHAYAGRVRPMNHYALGWLPLWLRLGTKVAGVANRALSLPGLAPALITTAGGDRRRRVPVLASRTFRQRFLDNHPERLAEATAVTDGDASWQQRYGTSGTAETTAPEPAGGNPDDVSGAPEVAAGETALGSASAEKAHGLSAERVGPPTKPRREQSPARHGRVVLFVDTFVNTVSTDIGDDVVTVLRDAGYDVVLPEKDRCCGLTWISTGQLDVARRTLTATVEQLAPYARSKVPIVGIEPSCTAVLRHDAIELLGTAAAREVAAATRTLAELLADTPDYSPPDLRGLRVVAQPHCHHTSVLGWRADRALLERAGAEVQQLGGCCGLAGNFGVEKGHYEVSVKVAEQQLLPAVREAGPNDVILADGFSCRTQLDDLAPRGGIHLATLLAGRARGQETGP